MNQAFHKILDLGLINTDLWISVYPDGEYSAEKHRLCKQEYTKNTCLLRIEQDVCRVFWAFLVSGGGKNKAPFVQF